jgi:hypothetical protein
MPDSIIIGQKGAFLQPVQFGRDDSGRFQRYMYEGTTREVLQAAYAFDLGGWVYTFTELHGGRSRVEARAGWAGGFKNNYDPNTDDENIWELEQQDTTKPLLSADFPFGSVNLSNNQSGVALQKVLDGQASFNDPNNNNPGVPGSILAGQPGVSGEGSTQISYVFDNGADTTDPTVIHLPSSDYPLVRSLYLLIQKGVDSFPIEASVIKHSSLVSNVNSVKASYFNMNRIISSASMYSVEGAPTELFFNIPFAPTVTQFIETYGDLQYGWRKVRPSVTRLAAYKWRIQQSYQFGLWSVKLFGGLI